MSNTIETNSEVFIKEDGTIKITNKSNNDFKIILVPNKLKEKPIELKDNEVWIGNYKYNEEKNVFEKIGNWLSFLQIIIEALKNVFKKK